ncbi:MAG: PDZ domain-containing protein, partial [Myxococcaceae bacterium]
VLDTGAETTFLRSSLFEPLTSDRAVLREIRVGSGFAGTFVATATRARTLRIGEHTSTSALVLSAPAVDAELDRLGSLYGRQVDGFLGWSFLREFEVSLALGSASDLTTRALGLERFDTQSHWTREFVGIGIYRSQSEDPPGIKVEGFLDPSPAQAAGLQIGDVIVKVDGTPVSGTDPLRASNEHVELELLRSGQPLTLQVEYRDLLPDPAP